MKSLFTCFFLFLSLHLKANEITPNQQQLEELIQAQVSKEMPGLAMGIVHNGQVVFENYQGMANLNDNIPISSKTKFNYASAAKQFTAYMLLELCLNKGISLDSDFRQILPDYYRNIKATISIKHLISHASGIRDYPALMQIQGKTWWKLAGLRNQTVLNLLKKQQSLSFQPGTDHSYSNSNYTLMTALIAEISGKSFQDHSDAFFQRMGMPDTHFNQGYMQVVKHRALPYASWQPNICQQYPMLSNLKGDGFLHTTLSDQLRWEAHLQKQTKTQPQQLFHKPLYSDENHSYGFGLEFTNFHGQPSIQHSGSTGAFNAHFLRVPEASISVVVMSNNGSLSSQQLAEASAKIVLGIENSANQSTAATTLSLGGENDYPKSEWVGTYLLTGNTYLDITMKDGDLYREMADREPVKLIPKGYDTYQYEGMDFLHMAFSKEQDQTTFQLHQNGLAPRTAEKVVPTNLPETDLKAIEGLYHSAELDRQFTLTHLTHNRFSLTYNDQVYQTSMRQKGLLIFDAYVLKVDPSSLKTKPKLLLDFGTAKNMPWVKTNQ